MGYDEAFCPLYHHAVELIGKRWTGAILRAMFHGATRFGAIRGIIPYISDRMLADRLRELEAEGIVTRNVIPSTPVRIDYTLTEKGLALERVVDALTEWAETWVTTPCVDATPRRADVR